MRSEAYREAMCVGYETSSTGQETLPRRHRVSDPAEPQQLQKENGMVLCGQPGVYDKMVNTLSLSSSGTQNTAHASQLFRSQVSHALSTSLHSPSSSPLELDSLF